MIGEESQAPDPLYASELPPARAALGAFVEGTAGAPVTVLCDTDVDGLGAGVVMCHYLSRQGFKQIRTLHPGKGENAFSEASRRAVEASSPGALFVLDLGVSSRPLLPGTPSIFVDHHKPTGEPAGAAVISGYNWRPIPTSSLLTYILCNAEGVVADKAWVAAIGNLGDLGPAHPELDAASREQKLKWVREATTLLNSAKRSSLYAVREAFEVLRDAESARAVVESGTPQAEVLRRCREEVKAELQEAKRLAPRFSKSEKVALLEFSSPARIHALLAQSWHGRLKGYIVIAANRGFLPGKVSFSVRTSTGDNLIEFLARFRNEVTGEESEYGHGHDQAAGGIVSYETWERLKAAMGF